ncbi:MAG: hypothetical protein FWE95_07765 [Planctomycetaceae bacterium]|nr:hypothetical protein [Planctomycetaceae bacterium]
MPILPPVVAPVVMEKRGIVTVCLFALPCVLLSGCLSLQLGGKTHNCTGSAELTAAHARIAQLESRISTLEGYAGVTSPQMPMVATTQSAR